MRESKQKSGCDVHVACIPLPATGDTKTHSFVFDAGVDGGDPLLEIHPATGDGREKHQSYPGAQILLAATTINFIRAVASDLKIV